MLESDKSALYNAACAKEHAKVYEILSKYKGGEIRSDIESIDMKDSINSVMESAALAGRLDIILAIQNTKYNVDILAVDDTLLLKAVQYGHLDVARYLLDKGAKFIGMNHFYAVSEIIINGKVEMAELFCEKEIYSKSDMLLRAASVGRKDILERLFLQGSISPEDLNAALETAISGNKLDIIRYLKEKGAVLNFNSFTIMGKIMHGVYHVIDAACDDHAEGEDKLHDEYRKVEGQLLKNVNPLVYKVDLSLMEKYREISSEMKLIAKFMGVAAHSLLFREVPSDIIKFLSMKFTGEKSYPFSNINMEAAMRLNFPTDEDVQKVTLEAHLTSKAWIALIGMNQKSELQKS